MKWTIGFPIEFLETAGQERWQTVLMEDTAEPSGPWSMHRLLAKPSTTSIGTFFFLSLFIYFFYWRVVPLQCCISFCCAAK